MLSIAAMGHAHPESEITNGFLEELDIGTDDAWIVERTGIRSRRTVLSLDYIRQTRNADVRAAREATEISNAELAARAGHMALERAGLEASDIGLVVGVGSVPDYVTPAEACNVAAALDIEAPCFDLRSACTSFGAALHFLSGMREDALPDAVLVVAPESVTRTVDYSDRSAAVLWGDAAAAAVLTRSPSARRARISQTSLNTRPSGNRKVVVPFAGYFEQEGATVQSFAIRTSVKLLRSAQASNADSAVGASSGKLHFVGHQANLLMLENVARSCTVEEGLHHFNVDRFGNTATAGSASVLSGVWEDIPAGDRVALIGVGAGLTWSSTMLDFEA